MLPPRLVHGISSAPWFHQQRAPFAVLDAALRLVAVNDAFARATLQPPDRLLGEAAFDVFPDDPADPAATGVANVSRSFERVLGTGTPDWMAFQRYDVPSPDTGGFLQRVWLPVNMPITDDGRVVGVLHHAQDVTDELGGAGQAAALPWTPALAAAWRGLCAEFPQARPELVLAMLTDSQRVVIGAAHRADAHKAAELARLRLEAWTETPALVTRPRRDPPGRIA